VRWLLPGVGVTGLAGPLAVVALLFCPASAAPVAVSATGAAAADSDVSALGLLERAAVAPSTTAYHGVQFVSAWSDHGSTSVVVEVDHRPGYGTTVRSNGTAQTPAANTFLPADTPEPSLLGVTSALSLLAGNYQVVVLGSRSVSGRTADLIEARRTGSSVPAARFWVDSATALVLRREVYDEQGRTTRASAFVELEVGRTEDEPHLPPAMPDRWADEVPYTDLPQMRAHGWTCPDQLPGPLDLVDARRSGPYGGRILHLSYSDGLATVSLFEQKGRLDAAKLDGYQRTAMDGRRVYVRDGVPQRVVWSADGVVFSVVADAPPRTVNAVVAALPHDPADQGGAWRRLGRGLDRVASWFNPFG
jgi:sigma-E factor negative regulatory protein RseB